MNEHEFKELWQSQPVPDAPATSGENLVAQMERKMRRLNRSLILRDISEVIACGVIIVWFGADLCIRHHASSGLRQLGDVVLILSGLLIAARLLAARRRARHNATDSSVTAALRGDLASITAQIGLLRSVWWWYLLPLYCGVALFAIGTNPDVTADMVALLAIAAAFGFVWWINQHAVKTKLLPLRAQLETAVRWTKGDSEGGTHA